MPLQSRLFRGDSNLEAALISDPAHILQGASGSHVVKIQQALIQLDGALVTADGAFGPRTAAAVGAFKSRRSILNAQGQIDNIVGKKTTATLDSEMLAKESSLLDAFKNIRPGVIRQFGQPAVVILPTFRPGEVSRGITAPAGGGRAAQRFGIGFDNGFPSLQQLVPLRVIPFNESFNTFILAKSVELPKGRDGRKNDLDTAFPPVLPLLPAEKQRIEEFERENSSTGLISPTTIFENLARAEAGIANQADGTALMDAFFSNPGPGRVQRFDVGSSISERIKRSQGFAREHTGVTADITKALQQQFLTGEIDYRKMRGLGLFKAKDGVVLCNPPNGVKDPPEVGFDKSEPRLVALIGSFQAATVILQSFDVDAANLTFRATLRYELIDHFGVDNSDVIFDGNGHGTRGQVAFWILQHKHRPGHFPFRIVVIVEKDITGSLLNRNIIPQLDFDLSKLLP